MTQSIDNTEDIIDSRDVIARIEELEGDREVLVDAVTEAQEVFDETQRDRKAKTKQRALKVDDLNKCVAAKGALNEAEKELAEWDEGYDAEELKALKAFADEAEGYGEWHDGATLIREDHFTDYARQLAEDVCDMGKATEWPFRCIDWEQAASELKQDYSSVEFGDVTYYVRS